MHFFKTFFHWALSVRKNYRDVFYHNWTHGFNSFQSMFAVLENSIIGGYFSDLQKFSLLVACLCHDLDHRGTNNKFQEELNSNLSQFYGSSSTMEQHHFKMFESILNMPENNIFANLSSKNYKFAINSVRESILATDLINYFT